MNVGGKLNVFELGGGVGVEIVGGDAGGGHDAGGGGVVFGFIAFDAAIGTGGDGGGIAPDELGTGGLHDFDEFGEVLFVICQRHLEVGAGSFGIGALGGIFGDVFEIVEAPVEMDDVPLGVAEPGFDVFEAIRGRAAVGGDAMDVGFAFEHFADVEGVAHGDGVADQEDAWQASDVIDFHQRRVGGAFRGFFGRSFGSVGGDGRAGEQSEKEDGFHEASINAGEGLTFRGIRNGVLTLCGKTG